MGARKKDRRTLVREGRTFFWYVAPDRDSADLLLRVVSEDKKTGASYALGQSRRGAEWTPHATVLGAWRGGWPRFATPRGWDDDAATPGLVRRLLDWLLGQPGPTIRVEWDGRRMDAAAEDAP